MKVKIFIYFIKNILIYYKIDLKIIKKYSIYIVIYKNELGKYSKGRAKRIYS